MTCLTLLLLDNPDSAPPTRRGVDTRLQLRRRVVTCCHLLVTPRQAAGGQSLSKESGPRDTLAVEVENPVQISLRRSGGCTRRAAARVTISAINAYVHSRFAREAVPRVSELARGLGVSRGTLTSAIKRLEGVTPARHLRRRKTACAEELLKQGVTIERVAREACYGTRRAFFRSFQAETGMTPATYRIEQNVTKQPRKDFIRARG